MTTLVYEDELVRVEYVTRAEWGSTAATEEFIRDRVSDPASGKTEFHVHHTAAVDDDATPNLWTYDDARRYVRALQTARPDLGPLPYSYNAALSDDGRTVWIFEGRGLLKRGAHTGGGHNVPGIGLGWLGNFDKNPGTVHVDRHLRATAVVGWRLRHFDGLVRLGDGRNPNGWQAWGHSDTSTKTCPGTSIYPRLGEVDFRDRGTFEEDEMTETQARLEVARVWADELGTWPTGVGTEDAQARLTRIAGEVVAGTRTLSSLRKILRDARVAAGVSNTVLAARIAEYFDGKELPAWILVPGVPATNDGEDEYAASVSAFTARIVPV